MNVLFQLIDPTKTKKSLLLLFASFVSFEFFVFSSFPAILPVFRYWDKLSNQASES